MISIIVPAYNVEKYIERCLDSILAQTHRDLEILVTDDGSTDRTGEIIDRYAKKDPRIRVIHQENRGLSGARNSALKLARGEFIGFVDSDDHIAPDMYESMYREITANNADIALCAYEEFSEKEDPSSGEDTDMPEASSPRTGKTFSMNREETLDAFVCDNRSFHIYYSVWSKLFRKEMIEGLTFPEGRNSEDILFSTKALLRASRTVFIDRPLYFYASSRPDSIMNVSFEKRRFEDEIPFLKEQVRLVREEGGEDIGKKAAYHFYRRMLFYYSDFRNRGMKAAADRLYGMLRKEKDEIRPLFGTDFSTGGDRVRMNLFLFAPGMYYRIAALYDRVVVPVRSKGRC
ncbi:MAG: glycosyltransferase [Lachnospiraceae bacterium]|nr:glycosyltransferase [Lachnospiraceae bacterium]